MEILTKKIFAAIRDNREIKFNVLVRELHDEHSAGKLIDSIISLIVATRRWQFLIILLMNINYTGRSIKHCSIICELSKLNISWDDFMIIINCLSKSNPREFNEKCPNCNRLPIRNFLISKRRFTNSRLELLLTVGGIDINSIYNINGDSILMFAIKNKRLNLVESMLIHGANLNHKNKQGETVFDIVQRYIGRQKKLIKTGCGSVRVKTARAHKSVLKEIMVHLMSHANDKIWLLLFAARYKNPDSWLSRDVFPLDLFKVICWMAGLRPMTKSAKMKIWQQLDYLFFFVMLWEIK